MKAESPDSGSAAHKTLEFVLDIIMEGVWDWNANTGHVDRSPGWYRMLGFDLHSLPTTVFTWEDVIHPDDYPAVMRHFEDYISARSDVYDIEYRCRTAAGNYLWIRDQGKIVERNADGSAARMIGAHLNIHDQRTAQSALERQNKLLSENNYTLETLVEQRTAELAEANRMLQANIAKVNQLSNTDFLTSLGNRFKLENDLHHELSRCKRYKTLLSTVLFDIDNFKQINDRLGHHAGDLLLKGIGRLVADHLRESDILGRWGGDEFLVILPGVDLRHALAGIEKIRKLIEESALLESHRVTCSFGVAEYAADESAESLYRRTDTALYKAKQAGRNRVMT